MKEERLEQLFEKNINEFSGELKNFYENFKYYNSTTIPQIVVLSANYQKQNEICQYFDKNNVDYDLKFVNAEEEENTLRELRKQIIFSDCVIIYTSALKIAPEGLYELCKYVSEFRKKIFFLLGGWNQIQKTEQKVNEKINKISEQMPFLDIAKVFAVFDGNNYPFFKDFNTGVEDTLNLIFSKYDVMRHNQEEEIFNYATKLVYSEKKLLNKQYTKDLVSMSDMQNFVYSKMNGYEIILKNSTVDLTDLSNNLTVFFNERVSSSYITYFDLSDFEPSKYGACEKKVKDLILKKIDEFFMNSCKLPEVDLKNKIEAIKNECQKEMSFLYTETSKIKSIPEEKLSNLQKCINDMSSFDSFNKEFTTSFSKELEIIRSILKDKINSISIDYKGEALKESIIENLKKLRLQNYDEESDDSENDDKKGSIEKNKDTEDDKAAIELKNQETEENLDNEALRKEGKAQNFCDVIIGTVKSSVIGSLDIMIHDSNNRFKKISKPYVDNYFLKIITCLEDINEIITVLQKDSKINA